jgi:cytochrome c biogenesis protein CcmG/thiol:disulfide interchange protein DsbE
MGSSRRRLGGLAFVLVLTFLVAACGGSAPAAEVEFLQPADFVVADYAGKPLVINFFASWCGPCKVEAPALAEFAAANPGVQFVGIARSDREGDVAAFMQKYGLDYPVVMDDGSLGNAWSITGVPTTIFIGSDGQETDRIVGPVDRERLDASLARTQ